MAEKGLELAASYVDRKCKSGRAGKRGVKGKRRVSLYAPSARVKAAFLAFCRRI